MYPWRQHNHFQLCIDGNVFLPKIYDAIKCARHFILIEIYLVESGVVVSHVIDLLIQASARNVDVYLLFDAHGSLNLNSADRFRLNQYHNIHLHLYNPLRLKRWRDYVFRDHRKIIITDDQVFVGGMGLSDHFDPEAERGKYWRETMLLIKGECVNDWRDAFSKQWLAVTGAEYQKYESEIQLENDQIQSGRVVLSPVKRQREIKRALLNQIRGARQKIYISSAYFIASRKLRRALCQAAMRDVDVRLLLPGSMIDHPSIRHMARRFYARMLRRKVQIFEYQPRFLHSKVLLCDDWVSIGSSNIDRWNLRWNYEANQEIKDVAFSKDVEAMFVADFENSENITYADWSQRSLYGRALEWFWGYVDQIMASLDIHKPR